MPSPAATDLTADLRVLNGEIVPPAKRFLFVRNLLTWYEANRRPLPWRRTRDPYAIWISEMMLQQTQVATVIPYWERWMERFPTVTALADAPTDDVLKHWQGLGYYARARNLHRAAQMIRDRFAGRFPENMDDILSLPGIGRYTAGAISSIAFGHETPIVDANVIRVLSRVFGIRGDPKSADVQTQLWSLAETLIPQGQASSFNQGMMELGALVCRSRPACSQCPVRTECSAFASGDPTSFPAPPAKRLFTSQTDVSALVSDPANADRLLLVRRPPEGLWGGLWEFPRATRTDGETVGDTAIRAVRETTGLLVESDGQILATVKHGVTTRRITLLAAEARLVGDRLPLPTATFHSAWIPRSEIGRYALSSPQAELLEKLVAPKPQGTLFDLSD
ncbi:MAG: A/G-specific adenine glycosylase [Capsulimonadales bacterium]|nr:A/G-specific adenine glycosylase [Capsulimonadales bacterium]